MWGINLLSIDNLRFTNPDFVYKLKIIENDKPQTIKDLAAFMKRDLSTVDDDLKILQKIHIVKLEGAGDSTQPQISKTALIIPIISIQPKTPEELIKDLKEEVSA